MEPAQRESVRIILDRTDTPNDALARKLLAVSTTCAYYPPERPEIDICLMCGLEGWSCVCDPCAPRAEQSVGQLERSRQSRLTRAELVGGGE